MLTFYVVIDICGSDGYAGGLEHIGACDFQLGIMF
jgi:hypothetical protein